MTSQANSTKSSADARVWNCTECWAVLTEAEIDDHECVEQPHEGNTSPQSSSDGSAKR